MTKSAKITLIKLLIVLLLSGSMLLLPFEEWGIPINTVQTRVIALFVFAALMWILEVIPIWTTSVLVITLTLLCMSNTSLNCMQTERYDAAAVKSIIAAAYDGSGATAETVADTQESVLAEMKKQTSLSPAYVRTTINNAILAPVVKGKADDTAKAGLMTAAGKLYDGELSKQIDDMKLVSVAKQKSIFGTFADPIIILFLGGFFLADAATKFRLDVNLARVLLKPFGTNPKYVLLGLMSVTAVFSMFMSNTATAAMMLALLTPVLALFSPEDRGRAAFALCIPIGANVGGIGTPIGTPPNAIALKYMQDLGLDVTFGKWMMFGIPFVIIMLLVAWFLLLKMFPITQPKLDLSRELKGKFLTTPKAIIVYATFIITILLWVIPKQYHGLDANSVAIVPIVVFSVTGVITKKDLRGMAWDVLWLVAGGFALGVALSETNLAKDMINAIPFGEWNSTVLLIGASCICLFMATFMSHTATAALLVPILGGVAGAMMAAGSMDNPGAIALLVTVAFASSLGMALPISTPPNAMAYATGHVEQKGMAISGTILCLLGLIITIFMMVGLGAIGFFD
ncbi:MAG: SLC13/DASS family transporter [Akkermansia sp.]|nr:SLC13/DASS family transporter [Akkermansia sp.]